MPELITAIDPEIRGYLNLEQEEIEAPFLEEARSQGFNLYFDAKWGDFPTKHLSFRTEGFSLKFSAFDRKEVPRVLWNEWAKDQQRFKPPEITVVTGRLHAFLNAFGKAALDSRDWETTIEAFNITTDGGILANEEVMEKLANLSSYFRKRKEITTVTNMARVLQSKKK